MSDFVGKLFACFCLETGWRRIRPAWIDCCWELEPILSAEEIADAVTRA
jgi:hypothetical protein